MKAELSVEDAKVFHEGGHIDDVAITYLFGVRVLAEHFPDVLKKLDKSLVSLKDVGLLSGNMSGA